MPKETFYNLPEEKRARIQDVAIDEFADNDYQNVSISRLVDRAGIAKGSFYQYFEDKEDLYRHLLDIAAREKQRFLADYPPPPEMDIFAYLKWLVRESVRFELAFPRLSQIGYRALNGNGFPPEFLAAAREQSLAFFRGLIARGKEHGDIRAEVDADLAAFLFSTVFNELGQYMYRRFPERAAAVSSEDRTLSAFLDSEEIRALFDQTISILAAGMGTQEEQLS